MGWNDHIPDIDQAAQNVAQQAKAIYYCEFHEEIWINNQDPDANKRAYAIGTNLWKQDEMGCTREEFMDAIKGAIEDGAYECPRCAKNSHAALDLLEMSKRQAEHHGNELLAQFADTLTA